MLKKSFKIDNNIYKDDVVISAVKDFQDIAHISYSNWNLEIESDWELDNIFNEFMNYCLAIVNEY